MKKMDLNVDIAEGFPFDEQLLEFASSANVCCGVHAGSFELTQMTVKTCIERKVRIGAHPGYPDRENMGRKTITPEQTRPYLDSIFDQIRRFTEIAEPAYLKPHGAFYNDTAARLPTSWKPFERKLPTGEQLEPEGVFLGSVVGAGALSMLLRIHGLALMGMPGSAHELVAKRAGTPLLREGFADRRYMADGSLRPRSLPDSVLREPAEVRAQVLALAPEVDTICLHGDTPGCLELAELVFGALKDAGYTVAS